MHLQFPAVAMLFDNYRRASRCTRKIYENSAQIHHSASAYLPAIDSKECRQLI